MPINIAYTRLLITLGTLGFVPHRWGSRWFNKNEWFRLRVYGFLEPFVRRDDWQQLRLTDPYPSDGYYSPGPQLAHELRSAGVWDASEMPYIPPLPPRAHRVLHDLRLLAVLDGLSDTELATWWSEAQLIRYVRSRAHSRRFRVPDGIYRSDGGAWVAVEVWGRSLNDPVLHEKMRDVHQYTLSTSMRVVAVESGTATAFALPRIPSTRS